MSEPVRSDAERELKMRCIEASTRSAFSNADQALDAAKVWFEWIVLPPTPPRGQTSKARSQMEARKRR